MITVAVEIRMPKTLPEERLQRAAPVIREGVRRIGEAYLDALKFQTPRGESEGGQKLIDSYEVTETAEGLGASYRIVNRSPKLRWVRRGRGPVVATRARALRFTVRGVVVFRKRVKAAAANDYPVRVLRLMEPVKRGMVAQLRGEVVRALR